jgi:hypothetical protein
LRAIYIYVIGINWPQIALIPTDAVANRLCTPRHPSRSKPLRKPLCSKARHHTLRSVHSMLTTTAYGSCHGLSNPCKFVQSVTPYSNVRDIESRLSKCRTAKYYTSSTALSLAGVNGIYRRCIALHGKNACDSTSDHGLDGFATASPGDVTCNMRKPSR